jgi:hypothetical protein
VFINILYNVKRDINKRQIVKNVRIVIFYRVSDLMDRGDVDLIIRVI